MRYLKIHLLKEFILSKPGRPYEQIERYADDIGATVDELHDAIRQVSNHLAPDMYLYEATVHELKKPAKKSKLKHVTSKVKEKTKPLPVRISIGVIGLAFYILLSAFLVNSHFSKAKEPTQQVAGAKTYKQLLISPAEKVPNSSPYIVASQQKIDAKKTFSFSSSPITLKYKGLPTKEIVGFFPYWMIDVADNINLDGFTTINLFGLTADGEGNIITSSNENKDDAGWNMWNDKRFNNFIDRAKKKNIKVLLTLKSFNNKNIETLIASNSSQTTFISNAVHLVQSKSLSGINIDFEYVGDASTEITANFTRLIANLSTELKRQMPDAVLTVDAYASSAAAPQFFDIPLLEAYVNAIIVMGYDIHSSSSEAGPVAPLEGTGGLNGYIQSYIDRMPPEKVILGVPYYGYDWPKDPNNDKDKSVKILSYAEIATISQDFAIQWDENSKTPYYGYIDPITQVAREVHFENTRSLGLKYDYVNNKGLKGVAIWAMGYDGYNQELQQLLIEKFSE